KLFSLRLQNTCHNFHSRITKIVKAFSSYDRVWVAHRRDDFDNSFIDNGIHTWRSLAVMKTRLKIYKQCRPAKVWMAYMCILNCINLSVRIPEFTMIPFPQRFSVNDDYCANERVWAHVASSFRRQREAHAHPFLVLHATHSTHRRETKQTSRIHSQPIRDVFMILSLFLFEINLFFLCGRFIDCINNSHAQDCLIRRRYYLMDAANSADKVL